LVATSGPVAAQDAPFEIPAASASYSPYVKQDHPNRVLFGDAHLHTAFSGDAGLALAKLTPDDAYRFAKGEVVRSSLGVPARLSRPLDWLVVTDHAENLGIPIALETGDAVIAKNDWGRKLAEIFEPRTIEARTKAYEFWFERVNNPADGDPMAGSGLNEKMWHKITEAAERHNRPGSFTALIGFEWTSGPNGNNLHRNVIFRDGKDRADRIVPISAYDTEDPERLWDWMERYENRTGGRLLAIAHNGNLSNGLMFDDVTLTTKKPIDADYARRRNRFEPIYEVTQIKGDGETHPLLSSTDEFADFENWDKGSFGPEPKTKDMLPNEYAREAWKRGLGFEARLGVNPFKFGVIGATDSHTGLATADEDNFFGKVSLLEPTDNPMRFKEAITGRFTPDDPSDDMLAIDSAAAGLAGVWARENTREAIFDAFERKEVYATTGPRMRVRVFGGWNFVAADLTRPDFAAQGYARGVPMGGSLAAPPAGGAPSFLIRALRDADGANLDRVQIIKGWRNADGGLGEKIFVVAWSGKRVPGANGKLPPVGNTVNPGNATYSNTIGAPILEAHWVDPQFDPRRKAFYYVRVIEIPTPRWTTFDAKVFKVSVPEGIPRSIQERAYTSPIWFSP
jgi:hypothetical protein